MNNTLKEYKLTLKRVCYAEATVKANSPEEAKQLFEKGREDYFNDFSEDYPPTWEIEEIEEGEE